MTTLHGSSTEQEGDKASEHTQPRVIPWIRIAYIGAIVVVLATLVMTVDNFATVKNLTNVLNQSAVLGILAIGMTYVLVGAGIDLSMPANMALTAILGTMFMNSGGSAVIAIVLMIAFSATIGVVNGLAVGSLQMIPFVVTLAMMTVVSGAAVWLTQSVSVTGVSESLVDLFAAKVGPVQFSVFVLLVLTIVATIVMSDTPYGRRLYATGTNPKAAKAAGIKTGRVLTLTYVIAGVMAGTAAVFIIARMGSASANLGGDQVVLDVVSAAVVGGVSIYGGVGKPYAAVLGAIFITAISNATTLMGIEYSTVYVIKGTIIIFFVALDTARRRAGKVS